MNEEAMRAHFVTWRQIEKLSWKEIEQKVREMTGLRMFELDVKKAKELIGEK